MNTFTSPVSSKDFYKVGHREQYPLGTTKIVSNLTPRSSRMNGVNEVVWFGLQSFLMQNMLEEWDSFFTDDGVEQIINYEHTVQQSLGQPNFKADHFRDLHKLGHLPIEVRALREGTKVPLRVPCMTISNTHPDFFWLTNDLETQISAGVWKPTTAATIAAVYRKEFNRYAQLTGSALPFTEFQGHDFSMRGMSNVQDAAACGAGHLLSFQGTDTIPAIHFLQEFYGAEGPVGFSVNATEHSVMCVGLTTDGEELGTINRLLDTYPTGILSVVSDTWDFWNMVVNILPKVKARIMSRDGKYVVRPDSGDPVKIMVGDPDATDIAVRKGLVECLWDIFGGKINDKGFKVLDQHIGTIYGDSITPAIQLAILEGLRQKGFASENVVLGIGSYTYNYVTRDTFGWAIKATYAEVNGVGHAISKAPKTDSGIKHSAKGLPFVYRDESGKLCLQDQVTWDKFVSDENLLEPVWRDGQFLRCESFAEIRNRFNPAGL